ncbi:hypothetical protein ACNKHU_17865 [Shigella flexneri]
MTARYQFYYILLGPRLSVETTALTAITALTSTIWRFGLTEKNNDQAWHRD